MSEAIGNPAYDPDRPYRGMVEAAKAAGLTVVEPQAAMVAAGENGARQLYFERDWHTNAVGNRVLAKEIDAALASPEFLGPPPHEAPPLSLPTSDEHPSNVLRNLVIAVAVWLILGTLYARRFPNEGAARSYGSVGALICAVIAIVGLVGFLTSILPVWIARWVSSIVIRSGRWEFCTDADYHGRCQTLGPGSYGNLVDMGLNDQISSLRPSG